MYQYTCLDDQSYSIPPLDLRKLYANMYVRPPSQLELEYGMRGTPNATLSDAKLLFLVCHMQRELPALGQTMVWEQWVFVSQEKEFDILFVTLILFTQPSGREPLFCASAKAVNCCLFANLRREDSS